MTSVKNVIVFALSGGRYAVELRWVREVFALGAVTPVPTAPPAIAGVVNFRGAIVPLLHLPELVAASSARPAALPRLGDGAILLEVEAARFAIRVDNVDEVTTLRVGDSANELIDARGRVVGLIDPAALAGAVLAASAAEAGADPDAAGGG